MSDQCQLKSSKLRQKKTLQNSQSPVTVYCLLPAAYCPLAPPATAGGSDPKNKCASSKVAIAGDATRRPSWHWQAVSMSTSDGSFNRLTLGPAPTRRRKLYSPEI